MAAAASVGWLRAEIAEVWPSLEESIHSRVAMIEWATEDVNAGLPGLRQQAWMAAHTLAGEFGMLGFRSVFLTARQLEEMLAPEAKLGLVESGVLKTLAARLRMGFGLIRAELRVRKSFA